MSDISKNINSFMTDITDYKTYNAQTYEHIKYHLDIFEDLYIIIKNRSYNCLKYFNFIQDKKIYILELFDSFSINIPINSYITKNFEYNYKKLDVMLSNIISYLYVTVKAYYNNKYNILKFIVNTNKSPVGYNFY